MNARGAVATFGEFARNGWLPYPPLSELAYSPGVGIDYNANDARAATLRGMSTAFTNVTMDGHPLASATSGGESPWSPGVPVPT